MAQRKGFTLVELVVVVMILGILAAVAAPKLISTSGSATDNGIKQSLSVIRDAIERYAADNGGALPAASTNTEAQFKLDLKSYLRGAFPKCPVGIKDSTIAMTTGADIAADSSPTKAWKYSYDKGEFIVNLKDNTSSDATITYDKL